MQTESDVQEYYEHNTRRFLRFGQGHQSAAIHRAIRHPDAKDPFRHQEQLILRLLESSGAATVVDLGCGVGSSLLWLQERNQARYHGITLSPLQGKLADEATHGTGIRIRTGSYLDPDCYSDIDDNNPPRLFFGIESWLHCPDPAGFFEILGRQTGIGDILVLWDDFLDPGPLDESAVSTLGDFREGWHALNVLTPNETDQLAENEGFQLTDDRDFTSFLEIDRNRDYLISALVPLLRPFGLKSSWWQNLLGGNALRSLLKSGGLHYRFRVWIRR